MKVKKPLKIKTPPTKNKLDEYCKANGHQPYVVRKEKFYQGSTLEKVVEIVKCKKCYKGYERPFQG